MTSRLHKAPGNFLLVGTQRTGSQGLFNALNLHPEIVCGGEWTQHTPMIQKIRVTKRALSGDFEDLIRRRPKDQKRVKIAYSEATRFLGFKILFRSSDKWILHPKLSPALLVDRLEGFLSWLASRPDIRIIQLVRQDPIEWLKSKYVSRETGVYTNHAYPDDAKVQIPIASAIRALRAKHWVDSRLASLSRSNPYCRVYYEDFAKDNNAELSRCIAFLDCDPALICSQGKFTGRQSSRSAGDYISNFHELAAAVRQSPYANAFLYDQSVSSDGPVRTRTTT